MLIDFAALRMCYYVVTTLHIKRNGSLLIIYQTKQAQETKRALTLELGQLTLVPFKMYDMRLKIRSMKHIRVYHILIISGSSLK